MKNIYYKHDKTNEDLASILGHGTQGLSCFINTLRPRQNGRLFADDTFNRIFLNENVSISINISLKFVPKGPSNNIPALVQVMAWRRPGDKPLSEPVMARLLTHICITRPQWVKYAWASACHLSQGCWQTRLGLVYHIPVFCRDLNLY